MPKLKLKPQNVLIASDNILHVLPTDDALKERRALFMLQHMRLAVPAVIVQGIPSVGAVINDKGDGRTTSSSKASTYKPSWVSRGSRAPKRERTTSWRERTLGIEAARACIIKEINDTMGRTACPSIIVIDVTCRRHDVQGRSPRHHPLRYGQDERFRAHARLFREDDRSSLRCGTSRATDYIDDASECIIMGIPMAIGTGMFRLQHRAMKLDVDVNLEKDDGLRRVKTTVAPEKTEELPKRPPLLLQDATASPSRHSRVSAHLLYKISKRNS